MQAHARQDSEACKTSTVVRTDETLLVLEPSDQMDVELFEANTLVRLLNRVCFIEKLGLI